MALSITGSNVSGGMNYTVIPAAQGSLSFNGLNQSLIYSYTSQFDLATGNPNFTIECWFYPRAITAGMILNNGGIVSYSYSQYQIYLNSSGLLYASLGKAGGAGGAYSDTYIGVTVTPITINNWYHVAIIRNGNYASAYLNGAMFGSIYLGTSFYPDSFQSSGSPLYIGSVLGDDFSTPTDFFYGYLSNVRITKYAAAYNSSVTIPTTPLTAIAGTSLLLNATSSATYLTDSSTNNFTVTNVNGVTYSASNPIGSGGSLSFNISASQYLSVPAVASGPLDLATGAPNWTIESWIYVNSTSVQQTVLCQGGVTYISNSAYIYFIPAGGVSYWIVGNGGGGGSQQAGGTIVANTWNHIAMVRAGNTLITYLNGVVQSFVQMSFTMSNAGSSTLTIGSDVSAGSTYYFNGYITNLRIVKGYAVYNSSFVPPNRPFATLQSPNTNGDPSSQISTSQTGFLLNTANNSSYLSNGSMYIIPGAQSTTAVGYLPSLIPAITSTSLSPFPGSVRFNGTTQSISAPSNAVFGYATGTDFTIEMWIYVSAINNAANMFLLDSRPASTQGLYTTLFISTVGNVVYYTNSANRITSTSPISVNTWYHVALVRLSGTTTLYLNGTPTGSTYADTNTYVASAQQIGASFNAGAALTTFYNGYISNLRIVKGVGVYPSTFTVSDGIFLSTQPSNQFSSPSAAITGSQTSLLLKTTYDTNFLVDYSTNLFTITNTGTATSSALNPFNGNYAIANTPGSVLFNGTSQYLQTPNSNACAFGTGDYTIEQWIYPTSGTWTSGNFYLWALSATNGGSLSFNGTTQYGTVPVGGASTPLDLSTATFTVEAWVYATSTAARLDIAGVTAITTVGNNTVDWVLYMEAAGAISFSAINGSSNLTVIGTSITAGSWYHVAVTRTGTSATVYVNGVGTTGTVYSAFNTNNGIFGVGAMGSYGARLWNGFITNLRTVKGIAVYTSNFTPSIGPLTATQAANVNGNPSAAVTGTSTSLLLNVAAAGTFLTDSSSNNYTVTNVGVVTYNAAAPFTSGVQITLQYLNNQLSFYNSTLGTGSALYISGKTIPSNTWTHVAISRYNGTTMMFINGALGASAADSFSITSSSLYVAASSTGANWFAGNISNVRTVKGVAVYTGAFSPLTTPLTAVTNTQLLVDVASSGAYLTDGSTNNFTLTPTGTVTYNTSTPVSSGGSLYFDQSTISYLTLPSSTAFNLTGNFTIQAWINMTTLLAGENGIFDARVAGQSAAPWAFQLDGTGKLLFFTGTYYTGATTISTGVWTHVAAQRSGSILTLYVNGVPDYIANIGTGAISPGTTSAFIGTKDYGINAQFRTINYITNLQFVNGTALFNGSFVPPAGPLQASQAANQSGSLSAAVTAAQTSLLLNTAYGTSFTQDSSVNNFTVTNVGTATSATRYPFVF